MHEFPKPTIAMIRGYCIGGGLGLAVCCDLRICTEKSTFALPAAKLGVGYAYAGIRRFIDVQRIELARQQLATPQRSIKQIAHALGFADVSHFSHVFRRTTGLSPSRCRQELLGAKIQTTDR